VWNKQSTTVNTPLLGIKVWALRIGCLGNKNKNTTFNAKQQAKRFFVSDKNEDGFKKGWKPKRLRATRQSNEFLCTTAFAVFLAEEQKELETKEKGDDSDATTTGCRV
jgi:hypothetical protein